MPFYSSYFSRNFGLIALKLSRPPMSSSYSSDERPEHDPFPLDLRVEHARPLGEGDQLVDRVVQHERPELRHRFELHLGQQRQASRRGRGAGRRPRSGR